MQRAKVSDGAVGGEVACSKHPKGDVLKELSGDLAGTDGARSVGIDHDFDHHGRMKGLVAWATNAIPGMKGRKIQAIYRVVNEVGQVPLGQPVLQGAGQ